MKKSNMLAPVLGACIAAAALAGPAQAQADPASMVKTYADIALAGYTDSLITAGRLMEAVKTLVAAPDAETLAAARGAWIAA
jgi:putative iron-regulated protein